MRIARVEKGDRNVVAFKKDAQVVSLGAVSCHKIADKDESLFKLKVLIEMASWANFNFWVDLIKGSTPSVKDVTSEVTIVRTKVSLEHFDKDSTVFQILQCLKVTEERALYDLAFFFDN